MSLTVLLGGARSGKSSLAVEIGQRHDGPVCFVATAPALDADMEQRIERHRAERPVGWTTVEAPTELHDALVAVDDHALVIIDCLTLWVSNLMYAGRSDDQVRDLAAATSAFAAERAGPVVAVSNEVGMGIHPDTPLGRRYRDVLGWVNQSWAAASTTSLLLIAGRAIELTDPWDHLGGLHRPDTNRA
jgi:adenosyl cobinamide kinase/adenosyl cobinamide phosphate guanylyltransferase